MTRTTLGAALGAALTLSATCAHSENVNETKASVPELSAFHEVIFPLWHTAWPSRDTSLVRELWPDVQTHVDAVAKAELPGILRDKKDAWQSGIERLKAAEQSYSAALANDAIDPKLAAVEELHSSFENLVRTICPVLPELAAFHEVLYRIYHYDLPNEDRDALVARLPALTSAMATLNAAVLPEHRAPAKENFDAARAELSARVDEVGHIAGGDDWGQTAKAIEDMHTAYRTVECVFD